MNTSSIHQFIFFALILGLSACGNASQETESTTAGEEAPNKPSSEEQTLIDVVDSYLLLKDALVASNPQEAQAKATGMLEVIDATNMMDVQQNAKQIAAASDLETQRRYFDSLSMHLYEQVKGQPGDERTLYRQYCPMAFDNRGAYWFSNAKEIRNPYEEQMPSCGRVEETITY